MRNTLKTVAILAAAFLFYVFAVERYIVLHPERELYFDDLPAEFDGFRIAMVSDMHLGAFMPRWWCARLLKGAMETKPDAIACLGDYVHARKTSRELLAAWPLLRTLRAPSGVWFINGNHDHWANHRLSLSLLDKSGRSLRLRHTVLARGKSTIVVAGTGDYLEDDSSVDRTLAGAPQGAFTIVLTHNPDATEQYYNSKVDLFLCGHSHGGQVTIPFTGYSPIVPVRHKKFNFGLKKNSRGTAVFISKGLGWSVLPVRFNTFPEVPVVVLRRTPR